ncbi:uncharacterized protein [Physcomitrium patens]|uniref:Uncharacterized protein n=2 Tax=Physcomitrium patens TaxID=3218 RepID=A0A2K1JHE7_PHYPA|nr:uncharacterized protein LOC112291173 isoform X2 [Physcomitrium patens]PNR40939.1 hypothetical protein PHYPA_018342 [Physcomitrium patens]|eukprot:XP_024394035.1 uncharacterized protein LOC112291173 isoform X2 [Physcomitrella patens]
MSYVQRDFSTALSSKDVAEFYRAIRRFVMIVIFAAPLDSFYQYMQELLSLEWRAWMSEYLLSSYFSNRAYFDLKMDGKVDNPDQRICEDVYSFVKNSVEIIALFSGKFLSVIGFAGVLWTIAPELVYFLVVYATFGTLVTVKGFGGRLTSLKFKALQREAEFRYSLVRVRDNVESIAFYGGESHEAATTKDFLVSMVENVRELIVWNRHLSLFNNIYEFSMIIVPSIIVAPRYFSGQVQFGVISQTGYAFHKILAALSVIVFKFDSISGLAVQTERLEALLSALETHTGDVRVMKRYFGRTSASLGLAADEDREDISLLNISGPVPTGNIKREVGPGLIMRDVSIIPPNSQCVLYHDLNLQLSFGESLLVMGPSGCGKSSLLRAVAGLWSRGTGSIQSPLSSDTFFLPQKPYMPLGSLRDQLLFPSNANVCSYSSDSDLHEALKEVALDGLPARFGGLDAVHDWSDTLSSGEQQRLAFARLFLHCPKVAFLDEASSALDAGNEARLYAILSKKLATYVSVGHRTALVKHHTYVLEFKDDRSWSLCTRDVFGIPS